jgi:DNA-binding NarL/FixJ family response regulator
LIRPSTIASPVKCAHGIAKLIWHEIEAAPKLKKLFPETPIILFTFYESMMHCFDAREIGVDAVVTKASGMFSLKESVKALLQRRHLTVRPEG